MRAGQAQYSARTDNAAQHMILLNPQKVLARGYSVVRNASGNVVSDAQQLTVGAELSITFAIGSAWAQVKKVQ
jgi:exodeoxyribonuclease VII large subunit